ncbi:tetratricopeptide repeat-containing sensor histidine kinase [Aquimarina brevivitae]|uniref:Tetratricopeptide repeat protein n=1 Tax=Aquimarina brevivitae TaxID=323412 RepID=A0A4Q7P0V3_9FLAO|nr:tetratricopeptide repeat protein [Aquimarina brevivitae]RZS93177.1 tetratricopeptide repeat protein [Aquimarina brevivitae]
MSGTFVNFAQTTDIEKRQQEAINFKEQDSIRVERMLDTIYETYPNDPTGARLLADQAEAIAEKIDLKIPRATITYFRGYIEKVESNNDKALLYFNQALSSYEALDHKQGISYTLNAMGNVYYRKGNFDKAIEYYKKAMVVDKELNSPKDIASSLMNIANIYADQGNYDSAINNYLKSLEIREEIKDEYGIAKTSSNLGSVYTEQGNFPKALEFYNKALEITEKSENVNIEYLYSNLGIFYKNNNQPNKALFYFKKGLQKYRAIGNKRLIARYLNDTGNVYKELKDYEKAYSCFDEALAINEQIENQVGVTFSLNNLADLQLIRQHYSEAYKNYEKALTLNKKMGYTIGLYRPLFGMATIFYHQKAYTKALDNALQAQRIAIETDGITAQRDIAKLLSDIYIGLKDYKNAFETQKVFKKMNDSVFNKENIQKITRLEYEYKYQKELDAAKTKEITLTKKIKTVDENLAISQRQTLYAIIGILLLAIVLGARIFILRIRNIKSINENILVEQKLLRSQMTPHFVFNSLSVLQGMILNKEFKKAVTYLSKFSKLLRITLENSRDKIVPLENELQALDNYVAVQNLGAEIPYEYNLHLPSAIDKEKICIPPMMIQPFVENAIEHAFHKTDANKKIDITFTFKDHKLICVIEDNGKGIEAESTSSNPDKKSLATTITSERLQLLAKEFKVETKLTIENKKHLGEQGTRVTIILPYQYT